MDSRIAYADTRLDAWAQWVRGGQAGWPSSTLLGRVIEQGASGAAQGSGRETIPHAVMEVDRAVARIDSLLRDVLKVYYLTYAASEVKAGSLGMSRARFWRNVQRGQRAVYDHLAGETETRYHQAQLHIVSI